MRKLKVPQSDQALSLKLLQAAIFFDPLGINVAEFSAQTKIGRATPAARFTLFDANGYSGRSPDLFLSRLKAFGGIVKTQNGTAEAARLIRVLEGFAQTPMDLHFGADVENGRVSFGFWLAFGAVDRTGRARFLFPDSRALIARGLRTLGFRAPRIKDHVLLVGFDLAEDSVRIKLYYVWGGSAQPSEALRKEAWKTDKVLAAAPAAYYFYEQWDPQGRKSNEKLFAQFKRPWSFAEGSDLGRILQGSIRTLSFGIDGSCTAYYRPTAR